MTLEADPEFAPARLAALLQHFAEINDDRESWRVAYQVPFLFGERRIEVEHERVRVGAQLCDDERRPAGHKVGNERDVAGQAVRLRHQYSRLYFAGHGERGGELRAAVNGVGAFAGFDLDKLSDDFAALGFDKPGNSRLLGFNAETRLGLYRGGDPNLGDDLAHWSCARRVEQSLSVLFGWGADPGRCPTFER